MDQAAEPNAVSDGRASQASPNAIDYRDPAKWQDRATRLLATCQPRLTGLSGYYECPPEWRWSLTLRDFDIWLVLQGGGTLAIENLDEIHRVSPGTLMFLRPGDIVRAEQDPDDLLTVVASHMDFFDGQSGDVVPIPGDLLPHRRIPFADPASIGHILKRLVRLQDSQRQLADVEASMLLGQAIVEMFRQDASNHGAGATIRDARVERVLTRIRQTPHHRMSLNEAAEIAGLSPDYFSRLFAGEMGVSFRDFAMHLRLERSRHMLDETDLGVSEIAHLLGYADVYLFSRQFKQHYGQSPRQARNQIH
jgi:AraC family transcriptional regulator of arabinose operon